MRPGVIEHELQLRRSSDGGCGTIIALPDFPFLRGGNLDLARREVFSQAQRDVTRAAPDADRFEQPAKVARSA